jgi:hypothetical protein|tara:strand:+ start:6494 stop:6871 length:378 start_codon:yes stop_codon:yes gene_type:complete
MADFPAIVPNARSFGLGNSPQGQYESPDGVGVRFVFNETKRVGQTLTLDFRSLTETQINSITNHFAGQEGSLIPFDLPSETWSGYSTVPVDSSDYQWRYASTFNVESGGTIGRFNVRIELIAVPT